MSTKEILDYFTATEHRATRSDLKQAVALITEPRIAIDCGCGAGSDIAYLRSQRFTVHAFDIEHDAIALCRRRFADDDNVFLSQNTFWDFDYPAASLIVADASLFFCPESRFKEVWRKITESLLPGGVFAGSFLGVDDTMAGPDYDREAFWPDTLTTDEPQIRSWLQGFAIVSFTEHRTSGTTVNGTPHQWHIYSVVAQKKY